MVFHENRLLADDCHEICPVFFLKLGKMSQNLPSAAVVIGALRVKWFYTLILSKESLYPRHLCRPEYSFHLMFLHSFVIPLQRQSSWLKFLQWCLSQ